MTNNDYKIISLIEKSIIYYMLSLFEDIHSQIEKYHNDKAIKMHSKIFQNKIFKLLSIPNNNIITNNNISLSQFNDISINLLENLDKTLENLKSLNSFSDELLINFSKINKDICQTKFEFQKDYEERMKNIYAIKKKNTNCLNEIKYNKLFQIFNYDLSKKSFMIKQLVKNDNLYLLIKKLFLFGIKYYNLNEKLNNLFLFYYNLFYLRENIFYLFLFCLNNFEKIRWL